MMGWFAEEGLDIRFIQDDGLLPRHPQCDLTFVFGRHVAEVGAPVVALYV